MHPRCSNQYCGRREEQEGHDVGLEELCDLFKALPAQVQDLPHVAPRRLSARAARVPEIVVHVAGGLDSDRDEAVCTAVVRIIGVLGVIYR